LLINPVATTRTLLDKRPGFSQQTPPLSYVKEARARAGSGFLCIVFHVCANFAIQGLFGFADRKPWALASLLLRYGVFWCGVDWTMVLLSLH